MLGGGVFERRSEEIGVVGGGRERCSLKQVNFYSVILNSQGVLANQGVPVAHHLQQFHVDLEVPEQISQRGDHNYIFNV